MKIAKAQLRAYYKEQGLEGSALGVAVWKDMCKFKKNVKDYMKRYNDPKDMYGEFINSSIAGAFAWDESPEGQYYWEVRHVFVEEMN